MGLISGGRQTTTLTLTNSEVALIKKGLKMVDSLSLGFEKSIKTILEKLKQEA